MTCTTSNGKVWFLYDIVDAQWITAAEQRRKRFKNFDQKLSIFEYLPKTRNHEKIRSELFEKSSYKNLSKRPTITSLGGGGGAPLLQTDLGEMQCFVKFCNIEHSRKYSRLCTVYRYTLRWELIRSIAPLRQKHTRCFSNSSKTEQKGKKLWRHCSFSVSMKTWDRKKAIR